MAISGRSLRMSRKSSRPILSTTASSTAVTLAERGSVAAVTGSTDQMCEQLIRRREQLGLSYILVSDELMDAFAPVVARLAGR